MSFTGRWILNHEQSVSQKQIMYAMGKPSWQLKLIDKADENLRLIHVETKQHSLFDKYVHIFLKSTILDVIAKLFHIPFNEVHYKHVMHADTKSREHPADEKGFGKCTSRTTFSKNVLTIRWYLRFGLLKVKHTITKNDQFRAEMIFINKKNVETRAVKIYDRRPLTEEDKAYIKKKWSQASIL